MKIKTAVAFFFCFIFFGSRHDLIAQQITDVKLNFTINSGYGFPNLEGSLLSSQGTGSNGNGHNPVYFEFGYNYSRRGLISVYVSDASATTGNFKWLDTALVPHTYSFIASIVVVGLSTRYYLKNGKKFLPYVGAMAGYSFVNLTTGDELPISGSVPIAHSQSSLVYQASLGVTYYLNKWLGLDAHGGYGNSYYAGIGLSFRFQMTREQYK